jgi:hypothetical protein
MTLKRYSSRQQRFDRQLLTNELTGARSYDRIAGYFSSSLFEVAGEALASMSGKARIVCNSDLHPRDVETATAAAAAIRQAWCTSAPELRLDASGEPMRQRILQLYEALVTGRLEVKVLPDKHFGLIHGKAGVITRADGTQTCFLGSVNESKSAWRINYELMWQDDDPESIAWVQTEFDSLWGSSFAQPLGEFVLTDLKRLADRRLLTGVEEWRPPEDDPHAVPDPASVFIESPVYRKYNGLWAHQKYFVDLAFRQHLQAPGGARLVLADQVGLGKTAQLAMTAALIAMVDERPVLVLAPKTLTKQWQDDLRSLLDLPSAVWNGRQWIDENAIEYAALGPAGIRQCPRRIGIVSTGLVTAKTDAARLLLGMDWSCIILDEAHRARRSNLNDSLVGANPQPNNLLRFLQELSTKTGSMLLATATPVQLHPIELWDLLDALNRHPAHSVLGEPLTSRWIREPLIGLELQAGSRKLEPPEVGEVWSWLAQPLPPAEESRDFQLLRASLGVPASESNLPLNAWQTLARPDQARVRSLATRLADHSPYVRSVVRRSRADLEGQIDPTTREPYLKKIAVRLHGEGDLDALHLPAYLAAAFKCADEFCVKLGERQRGTGFLKTLLQRRVGSTIEAGRRTAREMLNNWGELEADEDDDGDGDDDTSAPIGPAKQGDGRQRPSLTSEERVLLTDFLSELETNVDRDPKIEVVTTHLLHHGWLDRGCIVFSQYFDSANWLARTLSQELLTEIPIGVYAGSRRSGLWHGGEFIPKAREDLKQAVAEGRLRLLVGTDAASEGLNLQRLGTLINLDLPWNPTRLEQRKGRIQRIGQINDTIDILNLRYRGSVEDRVHALLSTRLKDIHELFGQLPDVLEDAWVDVATGNLERAHQRINAVPVRHPFELRYREPKPIDWESCTRVLARDVKQEALRRGWKG